MDSGSFNAAQPLFTYSMKSDLTSSLTMGLSIYCNLAYSEYNVTYRHRTEKSYHMTQTAEM